uniref:Protein arginine N-methyltransferase domain-containing protein n=1 Tax=Amorphochlora amoebiformis TaxID=1561963 RepID=A0A7S0GR82_9EUKA
MEQYMQAIMANSKCFKDKVVIDIGAGTGILSIWAARAGASRVYAIEATEMALYARQLIHANGLSKTITVIQGKAEEVDLKEKADIIISEWMGCFLLRESMLDTVIWARDNLLKKGGALYPSHARIVMAAMQDIDRRMDGKRQMNNADKREWATFVAMARKKYLVDMSILTRAYHEELGDYYFKTAMCLNLTPNQIIGEKRVMEWDLHTVTLDDLRKDKIAEFELKMTGNGVMGGLAGWFDVDFKGSKQSPATEGVVLSTSPHVGITHWGQQAFFLHVPTRVMKGDTAKVLMKISRQKKNDRMIDVTLEMNGTLASKPYKMPKTLYHVE